VVWVGCKNFVSNYEYEQAQVAPLQDEPLPAENYYSSYGMDEQQQQQPQEQVSQDEPQTEEYVPQNKYEDQPQQQQDEEATFQPVNTNDYENQYQQQEEQPQEEMTF